MVPGAELAVSRLPRVREVNAKDAVTAKKRTDITAQHIEVLSDHLIRDIGIPDAAIREVAVRERLELERRDALYRQGRARPPVRNHVVIVVDDGLATGASMQAAVIALRKLEPARIVVAA